MNYSLDKNGIEQVYCIWQGKHTGKRKSKIGHQYKRYIRSKFSFVLNRQKYRLYLKINFYYVFKVIINYDYSIIWNLFLNPSPLLYFLWNMEVIRLTRRYGLEHVRDKNPLRHLIYETDSGCKTGLPTVSDSQSIHKLSVLLLYGNKI